jgi:hypothetical protein
MFAERTWAEKDGAQPQQMLLLLDQNTVHQERFAETLRSGVTIPGLC